MLTERLHITLAITPVYTRCPTGIVERLTRAGEQAMAVPFALDLETLSIGSKSVALRPSRSHAGLKALQQSIVRAMAGQGIAMMPDYHFSPHLTLAYRQGPTASQQKVDAFGWDVQDFVLIRSLIGRTQHIDLGHWPLRQVAPVQLALF